LGKSLSVIENAPLVDIVNKQNLILSFRHWKTF